ncbi:hypothetical protein HN371_08615 [Candidatus Poribacteria bacterium]|nr:hypothetical protein [Candidatus Poribacteria bacterium]MBT7098060.1 hypothetical protein [Candidatus Poribacteria bacterium]
MAGNSASRVMVRSSSTVITKQVSADSTALSGKAMTDSSGKITKATAATDLPMGILVEVASSSTSAAGTVCIDGPVFAFAGGTITEGADVTADAAGDLIVTITKGDQIWGRALEDAADGDFFEINVNIARVGTYA